MITINHDGKITRKYKSSSCYVICHPISESLLSQLMPNKPTTPPIEPSTPSVAAAADEFKDPALKYNLSKFDYDLYKEEDDVAEKVIRVKRVSMPNKGEKWRVLEDNKVVFILEGSKLNNKEKEFLRSADGASWLLAQAKVGIKSFNALKTEIKKKLK